MVNSIRMGEIDGEGWQVFIYYSKMNGRGEYEEILWKTYPFKDHHGIEFDTKGDYHARN